MIVQEILESVTVCILMLLTAKFCDTVLNRTGDSFATSDDAIEAIDQFANNLMIEMAEVDNISRIF